MRYLLSYVPNKHVLLHPKTNIGGTYLQNPPYFIIMLLGHTFYLSQKIAALAIWICAALMYVHNNSCKIKYI